jgi:glc operon protein GlcG
MLRSPILAAIVLMLPAAASAQIRTTRVVAAEGIRKAIAAAEAEAKAHNWNVSIAVVDPAGELLGFLRLDGAPPSSVDVAQAKAKAAARFKRATRLLDSAVTAGRTQMLAMPNVLPVQGGVPILVGGEVVGAVGVSGATAAQDEQVATAGVGAVTP